MTSDPGARAAADGPSDRGPDPEAELAPVIERADVDAAARRLAGVAHRTPVLHATHLDELSGAEVFIKAECFQRTGSFKFRGAYNALAAMDPAERARGVVTVSSGNHAAAVALAARLFGVAATVVMPHDAPPNKRAATEGYGATVVTYDRYREDRDARGRAVADELGAAFVRPFDQAEVMAGQGTLALELLEEVPELDVLVVCVGGGGLIAGCATAARSVAEARGRPIEVVGVEPAASDDHRRSLAVGRRVGLDAVPRSIADGQLATIPGALTFTVNRRRVDRFVAVTDEQIVAAMVTLFERLKVVAEPSGASALAAVLAGTVARPGARIGVTLSGGNIDVARFRDLTGPVSEVA
ncbi:MAG: pyridoxal-phosphate dependent enzyme [Acidimicrobiales bacterium]